MKRIPLVPAVVAVAALIVSACGGGASDPQDYFSKLEAIQQRANADAADATDAAFQAGRDAGSKDQARALFLPLIRDTSGIVDRVLADTEALDPPSAVADAHDAYVDAVRAQAEFASSLVEQLSPQDADVQAVLNETGPENEQLTGAVISACESLQAEADDLGVAVDLECAGPAGEMSDAA